ncbi:MULTISPECIES: S-layer homology domain-containing protein [unclassified Paenibacillus]|uniref:S-layer homology domain-containing protein n=1 Tax=unclassified Paenibacillus TaxID=185978 RepID=UPI003624B296
MKKIVNYMLLFALLFSIIPAQFAAAAPPPPCLQADPSVVTCPPLVPNYFFPDDGELKATANMEILKSGTSGNLTRNTAKLSNSGKISIGGTFQQVTGSTLTLEVEQISLVGAEWVKQANKSSVTTVGAVNNRFQVSDVDLFQGYNRLTFIGSQGAATKKDVFYVLYDAAPLIKKMQINSNSELLDLNEGASLVLTKGVAYIQGTVDNANKMTINGEKASVLDNGLFYGPAMNLQPGLNKFEITIANNTDTITVKRQAYYYDKDKPFTIVDVTQDGVKQSLLASTPPSFTGTTHSADLDLQFLVPFDSAPFNGNSTITINAGTPVNITAAGTNPKATETVITNTYGSPAFKLVNVTVPAAFYPLVEDSAGTLLPNQPVNIAISYIPSIGGTPWTIIDKFQFKLASGQTLIRGARLLQGYDGVSPITDATLSAPLNGQEVKTQDFYIIVDATSPLAVANPADPTITNYLTVGLQPLGNTTITATQTGVASPAGATVNIGQVYKISNLPEGAQTIAFAVGTNPVSYTARVTYVSKLYIELDNLYEGQVIEKDTSVLTNNIVLSGKYIGFGPDARVKNEKLLVNNVNKTTSPFSVEDATDNTIRNIIPMTLGISASGPLFIGENKIKITVDYTDGATTILRSYVKEVKFYIVDKNLPVISDIRPLTPPTSTRVPLTDPIRANYLPPSPELQLINGAYVTTLSKFDLFVEGSGADDITIREGATEIFKMNPSATVPAPNAYYSRADFEGSRSAFKLRLDDVLIPAGSHTYTIVFTNNTNGAAATSTLTVQSQNVPYRVLSPVPNTGDKIIVNKNFVLFDIEAVGAKDVQINGNSAKLRKDMPNRYMYTLTGLKPDTDNKINLVIKGGSADVKETITVTYVSNPDKGTMFMEPMSDKHNVFNKALQLTFPKNNVLRREIDGKIEPKVDLLFGIADPENGNTELVNDYNQKVGTDIDSRTPSTPTQTRIPIDSSLSSSFDPGLGPRHFMRVSDYYWISAGMGEASKVGASDYKPVTGGLAPYSTEGTFTRYDDRRKVVPSERGVLTIKYDDSVVSQAAAEVTVFLLDDKGEWKNIGGKVDAKAKTVTVPFDQFGYYMVAKLKYGYDDISNHIWARDILQALLSKGYMPALFGNEFGADDSVTRGEFAGLMVRSLGMKINSDDNNTFGDILPGSNSAAWTYEEIETAARAGIVQGFEAQIFGADRPITREQAAVMLSRAMNVTLAMNDDKLKAKVEKAFADIASMDVYALPAIEAMNSAKVMVGSPVISPIPTKNKPLINFNPKGKMTRAEAAQIAVRLLQKYVKGALPANLS